MLKIPGASAPDFGPAAVNPGARPACGNPGNPAACPQTQPKCGDPGAAACPKPPCGTAGAAACPPCGTAGAASCLTPTQIRSRLTSFLTTSAGSLKRLKVRGLLRRRHLLLTFSAPGAGVISVRLTNGATLATGRKRVTRSGKAGVDLVFTKRGIRALRRGHLRATLVAGFTPAGGAKVSVSRRVLAS